MCFVCLCMCVCNLIDMVELEVLEEQQQKSRDGLDDDLLVTVHINTQLHALKDCDTEGHTYTQLISPEKSSVNICSFRVK